MSEPKRWWVPREYMFEDVDDAMIESTHAVAMIEKIDHARALAARDEEIARLRSEWESACERLKAQQPDLAAYQERNRELQREVARLAAKAERARAALRQEDAYGAADDARAILSDEVRDE